jgi:cephalosporin-C deacetylase-like acetyl esterase
MHPASSLCLLHRWKVGALAVAAFALMAAPAQTQRREQAPQNAEFEAVQTHFERVIAKRHEQAFAGIHNLEQWKARRKELQDRLRKMLWHDAPWPTTPPAVRVTHRIEHANYRVENLVLETAPKLFLTANLYLPKAGKGPHPVLIYQCGHANKNYYARHGAWFAERGIATLVMDNIESGEVQFTHHGVYSHAWFHWYSRGFSPLAVELWNARRAVDYVASRPDLDASRIGATGRSGGGATTFFLAAVDDRIAASAPVSGPISTNGWTRRRLTFAHCDCQYPVNSYGMLYAEAGAIAAPRPQLLVNADTDPGFPMDAFTELAEKMREAYRFYDAAEKLQTAVSPGGHQDTEAIRLPVFSFFLWEFLGQTAALEAEGPIDLPDPAELNCYREGQPVDERLTRIDEELVPLAGSTSRATKAGLAKLLREEVFRYFPTEPAALEATWGEAEIRQQRSIRTVSFTSFEGLRVKGVYSTPAKAKSGGKLPALLLVDDRRGIPAWGNTQPLQEKEWGDRAVLIVEVLDRGSRALEQNLRSFQDNDPLHHLRRQAMVAGTTLESMQMYEILRSLALLRTLPEVDAKRITILGRGEMGVNALYAALLDEGDPQVVMVSPTGSHRQGPHYLNVLRYTDIPQVAATLGAKVKIQGEAPPALHSVSRCNSLPSCLQ